MGMRYDIWTNGRTAADTVGRWRLVLLSSLIGLIPALSGTERGLLIPGLRLSDVLVLCALAVVLLTWGLDWVPMRGLGAVVAVYAIGSTALVLWNYVERPDLTHADLAKEVLSGPQFLLMFVGAYALGQKVSGVLVWVKVLAVSASLIAVIAILQYFDVGPTREILSHLTGNPAIAQPVEWKVNRSTGPFFSWHALGMYLAMSATIIFAVLSAPDIDRKTRRLLGIAIGVIASGMLTALTLTPVLLVLATLVAFGMRSPRARAWTIVLGVVGAAILSLTEVGQTALQRLDNQERSNTTDYPELPQTIGYRLTIWTRDYFPLLRGHELNGYGPLGPSDQGIFPYTESMYIEVLVRGGLLLLLIFVALLVAAIATMRKVESIASASGAPVEAAVAKAMTLITVFLVLAQTIHPYLADAGSASFMFCAWGVCAGRAFAMESAARAGAPRSVPTGSMAIRTGGSDLRGGNKQ